MGPLELALVCPCAEVKQRMCFKEEGVRHEGKNENWKLAIGYRKEETAGDLDTKWIGGSDDDGEQRLRVVGRGRNRRWRVTPPLAGTAFVSLCSHLPLCDREYILLVFKFAACFPPNTTWTEVPQMRGWFSFLFTGVSSIHEWKTVPEHTVTTAK